MKTLPFYLFTLLLIISNMSCNSSNLETLFQENTPNWILKGEAEWSFSKNELTASIDDGASFIITQKKYKNFELTLEFHPDSSINSGIFTRCEGSKISATNCYEFNIWDHHPNQSYRTGAVVAKSNPLVKVETIDKWNTYKIICKGDHIRAWVNDTLTIDLVNDELSSGNIALQAAGKGKVKFRNVVICCLN